MLGVVLDSSTRMWHVTLTVEGAAVSSHEIRAALERLSDEHPFLLAGRYASNRAEVRYWDEAADASSAVELAARLWAEHRVSAGLPDWLLIGCCSTWKPCQASASCSSGVTLRRGIRILRGVESSDVAVWWLTSCNGNDPGGTVITAPAR